MMVFERVCFTNIIYWPHSKRVFFSSFSVPHLYTTDRRPNNFIKIGINFPSENGFLCVFFFLAILRNWNRYLFDSNLKIGIRKTKKFLWIHANSFVSLKCSQIDWINCWQFRICNRQYFFLSRAHIICVSHVCVARWVCTVHNIKWRKMNTEKVAKDRTKGNEKMNKMKNHETKNQEPRKKKERKKRRKRFEERRKKKDLQ